tara:strand:- start:298 stop:483 length:186 start_codon:yes stop_codon:yes gene_type:complete
MATTDAHAEASPFSAYSPSPPTVACSLDKAPISQKTHATPKQLAFSIIRVSLGRAGKFPGN